MSPLEGVSQGSACHCSMQPCKELVGPVDPESVWQETQRDVDTPWQPLVGAGRWGLGSEVWGAFASLLAAGKGSGSSHKYLKLHIVGWWGGLQPSGMTSSKGIARGPPVR